MLKHLFIYNPVYGKTEETEHEKLLYFYPAEESLDTKMNHVGLSEALVKYTLSFSPDQAIEALHTQRTRRVYLNPEPNFWMSMTVELPSTKKTREGKAVVEYQDEDVHTVVLQSLLREAYKMYKLFNGSFGFAAHRQGREGLMQRLQQFFDAYVPSIDLDNSDVLDAFQGINFLPLDKRVYLRVQSFLNVLEEKFPVIQHTVFLFNEFLVWSALEQDDMRTLYKHLTGKVLQHISPIPMGAAAGAATAMRAATATKGGHYLVGPESPDATAPCNAPRIFVGGEEEADLRLVVYQHNFATCCAVVDAAAMTDPSFFLAFHTFVGSNLEGLEVQLGEQLRRPPAAGEVFRYIYFNQMNLAVKSSFVTANHRGPTPPVGAPSVSPEYMHYLADVHTDVTRYGDGDCEVILKLRNECWVVGRKSDQREFLVVLLNKFASIIDVNDEIKKQAAVHFANIFFLD